MLCNICDIVVQEAETASAEQQPQKCAYADLSVLIQTVLFLNVFFPLLYLSHMLSLRSKHCNHFWLFSA